MAERRRTPVYAVVICDGSGCRELLVMAEAVTPSRAVRRLAVIAEVLRERGVLGALTLREAATDRVVATRRVWP